MSGGRREMKRKSLNLLWKKINIQAERKVHIEFMHEEEIKGGIRHIGECLKKQEKKKN